jgi:hypothetical protein
MFPINSSARGSDAAADSSCPSPLPFRETRGRMLFSSLTAGDFWSLLGSKVNHSSQNLVSQVLQAAEHVLNNDIALAEESLEKGETSFHMVWDI